MVTIKNFISSILAGIFISIGAIGFLKIGGILGAVLFSIGLFGICEFGLNLFTGKVPYISHWNELPYILTILVGNFIGCSLMLLFPNDLAIDIINTKLNTPLWFVFILASLCNILIYLAVESYKENQLLGLVLSIVSFIICGFEHSIANACFILSAKVFKIEIIPYLLTTVLGNAFGGILIFRLRQFIIKVD